jgi:dephospho-CoA kinase
MLQVGLTGNIASGKSTVARLLADRGATIIDADELARQAVEPGTLAFDRILERWGSHVIGGDGTLDRAKLRRIVFEDQEELEVLNGIVHPQVALLREELLDAARERGDRVVVSDIPLLFENDLAGDFECILLVDAPRELRLERLVRDRGLSTTEAMAMIAAQMPAELKRARAHHVIENGGSREALERRVDEVWQELVDEAERAQPVS